MVQWLGPCAFTEEEVWVQSLVGELRSRKPRGTANYNHHHNNSNNNNNNVNVRVLRGQCHLGQVSDRVSVTSASFPSLLLSSP